MNCSTGVVLHSYNTFGHIMDSLKWYSRTRDIASYLLKRVAYITHNAASSGALNYFFHTCSSTPQDLLPRFTFSLPEIKSTRQLILLFSVWLLHLWFYPRWISCDCELFEHPPGSVLHLTNTISYRLQWSKTNKENDWIFFLVCVTVEVFCRQTAVLTFVF